MQQEGHRVSGSLDVRHNSHERIRCHEPFKAITQIVPPGFILDKTALDEISRRRRVDNKRDPTPPQSLYEKNAFHKHWNRE
jgi:hypothetical protein